MDSKKLTYVPGSGPSGAKLIIVGEAPGAKEEIHKPKPETLVGPSGHFTDELLRECSYSLGQCYKTNVFKYRPPNNDIKRIGELGLDLDKEIEKFVDEIKAVSRTANAILGLGNTPLIHLTGHSGINKWRGSILEAKYTGLKYIPALHPAGIINPRGSKGSGSKDGWKARYYTALDFKRAVEESKHRDFRLPRRTLEICKSAHQLYEFFKLYKDYKKVSIDIEAFKCIPICIGLAFSKDHAISIPIVDLSAWDKNFYIAKNELVEIWQLLLEFFEREDIEYIGQNFKYDHEKLLKPLGFNLRGTVHADVSILMQALYPEWPKRLAFTTSIFTREPYYKDEGKEFDPRRDRMEKYLIYNCKDAAVTYEIYEEMVVELKEIGIDYYNLVLNDWMQLHYFYMAMEANGIRRNEQTRLLIKDRFQQRKAECEYIMYSIAGDEFNLNSPTQISNILYDTLKFPVRKGTSESVLTMLYANHAKTHEKKGFLDALLEWRQLDTSEGQLDANLDYDGYMRSSWRITGAETGRKSTTALCTIQKPSPLRPTPVGIAMQTMTAHGIASDMSTIYIPNEGEIILNADLSQAEPRIVAVLSKDWDLLKIFEEGKIDIHKMTAGWFFGMSDKAAQAMDKEDPMRFIGKTGRNSGNYGKSKKGLAEQINTDAKKYEVDVQVSEWSAGQILDAFHKHSPKIRSIFHADIQQALSDRLIINPYGRRRVFFERWGEDLFREGYAHLGQSIVSDHMMYAGLNIYKRCDGKLKSLTQPWLKFVMEKHDAYTWRCPINRVDEAYRIIKEEFERPIDFTNCTLSRKFELVIPADIQVGENYKELRKYKPAA